MAISQILATSVCGYFSRLKVLLSELIKLAKVIFYLLL